MRKCLCGIKIEKVKSERRDFSDEKGEIMTICGPSAWWVCANISVRLVSTSMVICVGCSMASVISNRVRHQ